MSDFHAHDEAGRLSLSATARNRLKLAAKELRNLTGLTLQEIADRVGVSKSQWHNYESLDAPDLVPVHVYLPLELELGRAPVTRALASMNGLSVMTGAQMQHQARVNELVAQVAREQGEALAELASAAADGTFSRNEAKRLDAEFADVEQVAGVVRTLAAQILADKG